MATRTSVRVQKDSCGFTSVLASAVLEWFLIFLLFLDALFSYLVTKFAHVCGLQTPCPLCSRLDHVLGSEKPGFYKDLICRAHKLEISKLVYCCMHEKLSDAHGLCEGCISSITTDKKSDHGTYKSSMGKLEPYIEYCVDDDHNIHLKSSAVVDGNGLQMRYHRDYQLKDHLLKVPTLDSSSMGLCSCCNEPLSKTFSQRLLRTKSIEVGTSELDVPSSGLMGHGHLNHRDGLKKRREKLSGSTMGSYLENRGVDPLSYFGYTELKITSDSDSEILISDDDDRGGLIHDADNLKEEFVAQCVQPETGTINAHILPNTMSSDLALEKLIYQAPMPEPSLSIPLEKLHIGEPHDATSLASAIGNSMGQINSNQDETRDNPPAVSKLISSDQLSSSDNAKEALIEVTKEKHVLGIVDTVCMSGIENTEVSKQGSGSISTNSSVQINQTVNDPGPSMPSCMDLNDAYKLAIDSKGGQPSATFTELLNGKESSSIHDDLKLLVSQMAAVRGFELSWSDMSPRVYGHGNDSKMTDTSSAIGLQILPKRLSIERNVSGFESLDEILVNEIEGESAIDWLKRQVELDRKSMSALYKELEEERSASAIAANQAMAMINRLQEEKAAMQMEALQYQRMMEEQAEYDQEALQKSNDLLADREKEIQYLEEELETFRRRYPNELKVEKIWKLTSDSKGREMRADSQENNTDCGANNTSTIKDSLLDFEDEKLYILKSLERLENKLHQFYNNGVHVDTSELDSNRDGFPDDKCVDMILHEFSEEQDQRLFADKVAGNGGSLQMGSLDGSDVKEVYSAASTENNLDSIRKQIIHLNKRLKTLEEHQTFLEQIVNSLRNENEGLQFVQEIASHLRELRRIGMGTREQAVA